MMGKATTKYTPVRHAFLAKVAKAGRQGVRARGVAEGTACTAFRQLEWVKQLPMTIGIRVVITVKGERALAAWERGERGELDLRDGQEQRMDTLALLLKYSETLDLDRELLQGLLLRMPLDAVTGVLAKVDAVAAALTPDPEPLAPRDMSESELQHENEVRFLPDLPAPFAPGGPAGRFRGGVVSARLSPPGVLVRPELTLPKNDPRLTAAAPQPQGATRTVVVNVTTDEAARRMGWKDLQVVATPLSEPVAVIDQDPAEAPTHAICPACDGRGISGPMRLDCRRCKGEGSVPRTVVL